MVFSNERVQQSLPNRVWELLVGAVRCPRTKLRSKLAARVAQDRPKRGQEGPRWPKMGAKMAPKWSRRVLGKPEGGQSLPEDQRS